MEESKKIISQGADLKTYHECQMMESISIFLSVPKESLYFPSSSKYAQTVTVHVDMNLRYC